MHIGEVTEAQFMTAMNSAPREVRGQAFASDDALKCAFDYARYAARDTSRALMEGLAKRVVANELVSWNPTPREAEIAFHLLNGMDIGSRLNGA